MLGQGLSRHQAEATVYKIKLGKLRLFTQNAYIQPRAYGAYNVTPTAAVTTNTISALSNRKVPYAGSGCRASKHAWDQRCASNLTIHSWCELDA